MKRSIPFLLTIVVMFLAAACGSPASTATQAPATDVPPVQPAAPEVLPTQSSPVEETAPIGNAAQVDVTLADNTIDASQTEFQVGVPYTFVITNEGRRAHNFNISKPVSIAGSLEAALEGALLAVPQEQLRPGASVTVEYTFPDSAAGQLLEFSCLIRRHYDDGMLVEITVTN